MLNANLTGEHTVAYTYIPGEQLKKRVHIRPITRRVGAEEEVGWMP